MMVRLPAFFSSGMVIGKIAKIWGFSAPSEVIGVIYQNVKYETVADKNGRFEFTIVSPEFGGPFSLTIGEHVLRDVYVGHVWLCGGQSNMEEKINRVKFPDVTDEPKIRVFQVEKGLKFDGQASDVSGKWNAAAGEFLNQIYAVPFFFGQKLLAELGDVPIGLICNPAGGTPIEGWLPEELILPDYRAEIPTPSFVEKSQEEAETAKRAWTTELNEKDPGLTNEWFRPAFDDSNWKTQTLLDNTDFPKRGSVWLRKKFTMQKKPSGAAVLSFGRVENSVTVYINGVEVIHLDNMHPQCICTLPKDLLTKGENTIAVRVVGDAKPPQIVPDKDYFLLCPEKIDLGGDWKSSAGTKMPQAPPDAWFYGRPCGVYNYMMAPLLGLSIEGLIWYQGESNVKKPEDYAPMFTTFAALMRRHFGESLPIIFTQLANFVDQNAKPPFAEWAKLREQQRQCLKIPNTAMAVTIDCGEYNDLHPFDKKTVGERLALHALRLVYNKEIAASGPVATHAEFNDGRLIIHFSHAPALWAKNGHPLLDIFGENENPSRHYAKIKGTTLTCKLHFAPKKVRHGWVDNPSVTLYNAHNLPASPFELLLQED